MTTSILAIALTGLATTLIGSLLGPVIMERRSHQKAIAVAIATSRHAPYSSLLEALETLQYELDFHMRGSSSNIDAYKDSFVRMEVARSQIDLVGTTHSRVWAYRCRLAVVGAHRSIDESPDEWEHYRQKLHDARKEFVTLARLEIISTTTLPRRADGTEDSAAAHMRWLQSGASSDAQEAIHVAYSELVGWTVRPNITKNPDKQRNG